MASFWPEPVEYAEAVQTPRASFGDPDLQAATAEMGMLGPVVYSGGFASVYHLVAGDERQSWAVKCFTKQVAGQRERYRLISEHLDAASLGCAVDFQYQEMGVRVRDEWFPILKMDWVSGTTLAEFVDRNIEDYRYLGRLCSIWLRLEPHLREAQTVHGDLQHGNVMLVPGQSQGKLALRLIDYDGLWTPDLAGSPSGESGHAAYQHPDRHRLQIYSPEIDRFPHLVIAAALRCLARPGQVDLWRRYYNGDNLMFAKSDFAKPASSGLLNELWTSGIPELQSWAGLIAVAATSPLNQTPRLKERLVDGRLSALTIEEMSRAREILGPPPEPAAAGLSPRKLNDTGENFWEKPLLEFDTENDAATRDSASVDSQAVWTPVVVPDRALSITKSNAPDMESSATRGLSVDQLVFGVAAGVLVLGLAIGLIVAMGGRGNLESSPSISPAAGSHKELAQADVTSRDSKGQEADQDGNDNRDGDRTQPGSLLESAPDRAATARPVDNAGTKNAANMKNASSPASDPTGRLQMTIRGHSGPVTSVEFDSAGKRLASAGGNNDHTVKIWDAANGQELQTLKGHTGSVWTATFSPVGSRLATGSSDHLVIVWDASSGNELLRLKGHTDAVRSIAFLRDGTRLATAANDGTVKVWDAISGQNLFDIKAHSSPVASVAYRFDGARLATASSDKTAKLWDAANGAEIRSLNGHVNLITSVAFNPRGDCLATASFDFSVKLWNVGNGIERITLKEHSGPVTCAVFSPDGAWVASGSRDQTARLWDATTGNAILTLQGHAGPLSSVSFSPDGKQLATASDDRTIKIWKLDARGGSTGLPVANGTVASSTDAASNAGSIVLKRAKPAQVRSLAMSPTERRLAAGYMDGDVTFWDLDQGNQRQEFKAHSGGVTVMAYSPDGRTLATSDGNDVGLWDVATRTRKQTIDEKGTVSSLAFSPDGLLLAAANSSTTINLWYVATAKLAKSLKQSSADAKFVRKIAVTPDGTNLVSGHSDGSMRIWDVATGFETRRLAGHPGYYIDSLNYSSDGLSLASSSRGGVKQLVVWNTADGAERVVFPPGVSFDSVTFSPDGKTVAAGCGDHKIRLWNAATAAPLSLLSGHTDSIVALAFAKDGKTLASGSLDADIRLWTTSVGPAPLANATSSRPEESPERPVLVSPRPSAVLSARSPPTKAKLSWRFTWREVNGATKYHLHLQSSNATNPALNDANITTSTFNYEHLGASVGVWNWRVRAFVNGQWSEWSEVRRFVTQ